MRTISCLPLLAVVLSPAYSQPIQVAGLPRHNVTVSPIGLKAATIHNGSGQDILALNAVWRPSPELRPIGIVGMLEIDERKNPAIRAGESVQVTLDSGWNPVSLYIVALFRDGTIAGPDETDPEWSLRAELREKYAAEREVIARFHELIATGKQDEARAMIAHAPRQSATRKSDLWHSLFLGNLQRMTEKRGLEFADQWASNWMVRATPITLTEAEP